jgi:hypothetical protein
LPKTAIKFDAWTKFFLFSLSSTYDFLLLLLPLHERLATVGRETVDTNIQTYFRREGKLNAVEQLKICKMTNDCLYEELERGK